MQAEDKQALLEKLQALKRLHIFKHMHERSIAEILRRCHWLNFASGEKVFSEGDTDASLYLIMDGNFEVASSDSQGKKITFFFAGDGLIFGEMSFLDGQPRSATLTAAEPSQVLQLSRNQYQDLLEKQPTVAAELMFAISEILSRRLRGSNRRLKYAP